LCCGGRVWVLRHVGAMAEVETVRVWLS